MDNSPGERKRWTISERLDIDRAGEEGRGVLWILAKRLFGDGMIDINDLEPHHYTYFLNHVSSLGDLIAGLRELSPLADDALSVAEKMSENDFEHFKRMLKKEREGITSKAPEKFRTLLFPGNFLEATIMAEKFEVCLGVALIQLAELTESPPS